LPEAQLLAWFDLHPPLRARITLRVLERRPYSQQALEHIIAGGDDRMRLLVQLARGAPDALSALELGLRASDPNERLFAASLAGAVGDPRSNDGLWQLVTFSDDRYYPKDALLRHAGMAALIQIALAANRRQLGTNRRAAMLP
jgi:hypothetical protein